MAQEQERNNLFLTLLVSVFCGVHAEMSMGSYRSSKRPRLYGETSSLQNRWALLPQLLRGTSPFVGTNNRARTHLEIRHGHTNECVNLKRSSG